MVVLYIKLITVSIFKSY